ncbi:transporter substrate-binding domain-containing protein [Psychromonas sp. MME2]|uniref:substrate-binding periplasmic protein n=1 Tax=unclassified Psychromonas TaxID=2614957 RepID=UPI00339C3347
MKHKFNCLSYYLCLFWVACVANYSHALNIDDIDFITENYPPYNYLENGQLQGISIDLLLLMLNKLESKKSLVDIHIQPWARGYSTLITTANTCLFSVVRTKARDPLFHWIGPISATSIAMIARKDKHIKINSKEDFLKYKIGVVRADVGEQLLLEMGVDSSHLDHIGGMNVIIQSIKKLDKNRLDVFAYDNQPVFRTIKKHGLNVNDYEVVYVLQKGDLYYACNRKVPEVQIKKLQNVLDQLKAEGTYQQVVDRYQNKFK